MGIINTFHYVMIMSMKHEARRELNYRYQRQAGIVDWCILICAKKDYDRA